MACFISIDGISDGKVARIWTLINGSHHFPVSWPVVT